MVRINNIGTLDGQQQALIFRLQQLGQAIEQNNLRLSTLRRINSAADDPAGIVAVSRFRTEIGALQSTTQSLTQSSAMISAADDNAGEILEQLQAAHELALEVAGGSLTTSEAAAKQSQLDSILDGIDSIAQQSYNGTRLLDGSSSYSVTGVDATKISNVRVLGRQSTSDLTVNVNVTAAATRATNSYTGGALSADAVLTIDGPKGSTTISLDNGATTQDITDAFNAVTYLTGVTATRVDASTVNFATADYGSAAEFSIEANAGTFATTTSGTTSGTDATAVINGQAVTGDGSTFSVNSGQTLLEIAVNPATTGVISPFVVSGSGLSFTLGLNPSNRTQLGLPNLLTARLNGVHGTLTSVRSGEANSLVAGDTANGVWIIEDAITQVAQSQSLLGSFQRYTLDSANNVLQNIIINETKALNALDLVDVAEETSVLTNNKLLQQSTLQSLQLFNQEKFNVLNLLEATMFG